MYKINVKVNNVETIDALPNNWTSEDFKAILELYGMDTNGIRSDELMEFTYMTIADHELPFSAELILKYVMGDILNDGQYQNIAHEMADDRVWEEYPEISLHKYLFGVNQLLYRAYNGKVPHGEAMTLSLTLSCDVDEVNQLIQANNPDVILRCIMGGMDEHAIMQRLYASQLGDYLTDAAGILWEIESNHVSDTHTDIKIISSKYWLDDFIATGTYDIEIKDLEMYQEKIEE
ncbi:MAG: hypothetical protein WAU01_07360 [Saprospiraceae bacterium]